MATLNRLTNVAVKAAIQDAKAAGKTVKLSDGGGLYLLAQSKNEVGYWRYRYFNECGEEQMLSVGTFPMISLAEARVARDRLVDQRKASIDPSKQRREARAAATAAAERQLMVEKGIPLPETFAAVAYTWYERVSLKWSAGHAKRVKSALDRDLIPFMGAAPMRAHTPPSILEVLRKIEHRGAGETAYRTLRYASAIFREGVLLGFCESDPTRDLEGAIATPETGNRAAIVEPVRFGQLLRDLDAYQGTPVVRAALALAPLVFLRPGELRQAKWGEFDFEDSLWAIPVARMKGDLQKKGQRECHFVPLSKQAKEILLELRPLTGGGDYVFPGARGNGRPMSDNAVLSALRALGYPKEEMSGHGFRATARTMGVERLGFDKDILEAQLAHKPDGPLGTAYDRTNFAAQRRDFMQKWADYLDVLKADTTSKPVRFG